MVILCKDPLIKVYSRKQPNLSPFTEQPNKLVLFFFFRFPLFLFPFFVFSLLICILLLLYILLIHILPLHILLLYILLLFISFSSASTSSSFSYPPLSPPPPFPHPHSPHLIFFNFLVIILIFHLLFSYLPFFCSLFIFTIGSRKLAFVIHFFL